MKISEGTFCGNPTEIGIAKGKVYSETIKRIVFQQHPFLSQENLIKEKIYVFRSTVKSRAPEIFNEIEGIADGAVLSHNIVWAYNLLSEIAHLNTGCTIFGNSLKKNVLIGKTNDGDEKGLDWFYSIERTNKKEKHAHLSVAWQGTVWSIGGVNDAGIAIAGSSGHGDDFNINGFPTNMLIKLILENCASLSEAIDMVIDTPTTGSPANYIIGSKDGELVVIEKTPHTARITQRGTGPFYRTNRFLHPELILNQEDIDNNIVLKQRIENCCKRESFLSMHLSRMSSEEDFRNILIDSKPVGAIFQTGQESFYTAVGIIINSNKRKISVSLNGGAFFDFFLYNYNS